jgi:flavodoxin
MAPTAEERQRNQELREVMDIIMVMRGCWTERGGKIESNWPKCWRVLQDSYDGAYKFPWMRLFILNR